MIPVSYIQSSVEFAVNPDDFVTNKRKIYLPIFQQNFQRKIKTKIHVLIGKNNGLGLNIFINIILKIVPRFQVEICFVSID